MTRYFFLFFIISACSSAPTGKQVLKKSIDFHDPNNKWNSLLESIHVKSDFVYPSISLDSLIIGLDNAKQLISYHNLTLGQEILFSDSTCLVISGSKSCEQSAWTKNFYHFILGLPMTLQNEDGIVHEFVADTSFYQKPSYRVRIDFEKEKWHFYFDKADFQLVGFAFNKNFESKAEEIRTDDLIDIDGMNLIKSRSWWITTDSLAPTYSGKDEIIGSVPWLKTD
ncbi:hypothetical protein LV84_00260 [Algoriphagus ratkowskyi]|uniref:Uncharacterized protein n=1 Tax=Algoriphagus ratkowskyi TaxID=57028 RepID=A0A2W7TD89_9BACT|nr:DUF6503 family protein [Algoriphagus ratkowskyi]PZX61272.1 hypothetical protein LV84_00260 [Algoriphagus ratkowskyi]TXD79387.1 hypothetical protein ESW18_03920 [Algoriphagus ratkowskyi]